MSKDLRFYIEGTSYQLIIQNKNNQLTTTEDIDIIKNYPNIDEIIVIGLNQECFEYFIKNYGQQFKVINFFRNEFNDISLLSSLKKLEYIVLLENNNVTKLWNMTDNENLKGIAIYDYNSLHDLDLINTATNNLIEFVFGQYNIINSYVESLKPLRNLKLTNLALEIKSIKDNDINPFTKIKTLKVLDLPINLLTTAQVAFIKAKLPNTTGYSLRPYLQTDSNLAIVTGTEHILLDLKEDRFELDRYVQIYNDLVEKYKNQSVFKQIK